jgi:hypothetical protein
MMDTLVSQALALLPVTITALASLIVALRNSSKIHNIHVDMNSKFSEWMALVKQSSFAEGVKSERDKPSV